VYAFHGIVYLLWHVVMFPVHLVLTIVKYLIVAPIVLLITLALLLFSCVALVTPNALHLIPVPGVINDLSSQVQIVISPKPLPTKVTCNVKDQAVVVTWSGPNSDLVPWYQVLRRPIADSVWRRIAIMPGADSGQYIYGDNTAQHGVTYQYGVVAILTDGTESEVVISPVQVVAP
jgi:hypothetical protein